MSTIGFLVAPFLATPAFSVPDSGSAGILLGVGLLSLGAAARWLKNRTGNPRR